MSSIKDLSKGDIRVIHVLAGLIFIFALLISSALFFDDSPDINPGSTGTKAIHTDQDILIKHMKAHNYKSDEQLQREFIQAAKAINANIEIAGAAGQGKAQ